MARNTDIDSLLFPVWQQPVFLTGSNKPITGYKAVTGNVSGKDDVIFSIVSDGYKLVTNEEALKMGKEIHKKLFPSVTDNSFEIFNIISPNSKSFCHIDIIDKNYTLNIWEQEVYVPFIRIHNSYNKSRSLQFDIGFCRKLCNNGVIFEQNTISLKFAHTKQAISLKDIEKIDVSHLKKLEQDFIKKTKKTLDTNLPGKYFIPLAAKTLERNFNSNVEDRIRRKNIEIKKQKFIASVNEYANRYIHTENLGETAYAFFNVITDYASNNENVNANGKNGLQTKCGMWINQLGELVSKPGFSWDKEIKGFEYLLEPSY